MTTKENKNIEFSFFFQRELAKFEKLINNVQTDEVALDEKIAKRQEEKDRHQRRLDMLKNVRYEFICCLGLFHWRNVYF